MLSVHKNNAHICVLKLTGTQFSAWKVIEVRIILLSKQTLKLTVECWRCESDKSLDIPVPFFRLIRFSLNMLIVLLVLTLGTVSADCSKEEEQNSWNTIQWFIRNISLKINFNFLHSSFLKFQKLIRAGNFRMVNIEINAWSTLFLNLQTNLILYPEKCIKAGKFEIFRAI